MTDRKNLLVAYDGSSCADAALDDLQHAGLPSDAEAVVVAIAEAGVRKAQRSKHQIIIGARKVKVPSDLKRVYSRDTKEVQEALRVANYARERVQTIFPNWKVTAAAEAGVAGSELLSKAAELKTNLIVLGSHGRTGLNRLMLGSVSQSVLARAKCSVRVARGRVDEPGLPVRILIGLDGSTASETAVLEVARRSWPAGTEVRILVVEDPLTPTFVGRLFPPLTGIVAESNREDLRWIERELAKSVMFLSGRDLIVSTAIREGEPKRVLVEVAEEWRADSIFLGAIGFGNRLERFLLGSVSAAVAAHASCSVEVVRKRTPSMSVN